MFTIVIYFLFVSMSNSIYIIIIIIITIWPILLLNMYNKWSSRQIITRRLAQFFNQNYFCFTLQIFQFERTFNLACKKKTIKNICRKDTYTMLERKNENVKYQDLKQSI